jgi:hypothetical protein
MFAASATSDAIEAPRLRSHNPTTSVAKRCSTLQNRLIYADFFAGGCPPLLRGALSMVSNSIAGHYHSPPCRTEYLVGRGDLVQDLLRAVEITPASPRDKGVLSHPTTGGPHMTRRSAPGAARARARSPWGRLTRAAQRPSCTYPSGTSTCRSSAAWSGGPQKQSSRLWRAVHARSCKRTAQNTPSTHSAE